MKKSGRADLPLHYGKVPSWLYQRMAKMGLAITESIVLHYGPSEFIRRISDPFWFQSLGAALGMDWHSSGITTSVMGSLKQAINPHAKELGIYICGGRGKHSLKTPEELISVSNSRGLNGNELVNASKLTAKIDNTAIQDGFQLYLHSFILTHKGEWAVVQQGMNGSEKMARRYHWHSKQVKSFVEEPHTSVCGENQGEILNLTDKEAKPAHAGILSIAGEHPDRTMKEIQHLMMPHNHDVKVKDVDLKRLGSVLALAYEKQFQHFEELLLLKGLGPKTLRSLTLISEVIHGTPSRFKDPARFSFAHGGKDGHPFPVQTSVYDESLLFLKNAVHQAKIGYYDKQRAMKKITGLLQRLEKGFIPNPSHFKKYVSKEIRESKNVGGRTVFDDKHKQHQKPGPRQLNLFE